MLPNAFIGENKRPTELELTAVLGAAKKLWDKLAAELADELDIDATEWSSYSRKAGWALRLKRKDRNIVYLSPHQGCFTASFALGDKAVQAALRCKLSKRVLHIIKTSKRYAEGTAVRIDVKEVADVAVVKTLAALKLKN